MEKYLQNLANDLRARASSLKESARAIYRESAELTMIADAIDFKVLTAACGNEDEPPEEPEVFGSGKGG